MPRAVGGGGFAFAAIVIGQAAFEIRADADIDSVGDALTANEIYNFQDRVLRNGFSESQGGSFFVILRIGY